MDIRANYKILYDTFTEDDFHYYINIKFDFMKFYHQIGPIPFPLLDETLQKAIDLHHEAIKLTAQYLFDNDETS